jgi:hypothetical protein
MPTRSASRQASAAGPPSLPCQQQTLVRLNLPMNPDSTSPTRLRTGKGDGLQLLPKEKAQADANVGATLPCVARRVIGAKRQVLLHVCADSNSWRERALHA